jgi:hypothetical protein
LGFNADGGPIDEANPATVSSFNLDKYLVTVGRFRQFVHAWNGGAGWLPAPGSGKHTHLNGGQGLVVEPSDAGTVYEPGWVPSGDMFVEPTDNNLNLTMLSNNNFNCAGGTWTSLAGSHGG